MNALVTLPVRADDIFPPPAPAPADPVSKTLTIKAAISQEWRQDGYDIAVLRTGCEIRQGDFVATSDSAVVWLSSNGQLIAYFQGDVRIEDGPNSYRGASRLIRLNASGDIKFEVNSRAQDTPAVEDPLYRNAIARQQAMNRQIDDDLVPPAPAPSTGGNPLPAKRDLIPVPDPNTMAGQLRRVRIFPRSSVPYDVLSFESDRTIPPEQVIVLTGGVNLLIDGFEQTGVIDLSADRIVIWTQAIAGTDFQAESLQTHDTPMTVYLEGNIVIRQGGRIMRAERAVYDARQERAMLTDAELRTFLPQFGGDVRVRAERLRQLSKSRFQAENAWLSTSQFGKPGYRLQTDELFIEPRYDVPWLGLGDRAIDQRTGEEVTETPWFHSKNTKFMVHDIPLFYLPKLSGPAEDPNIPLEGVTIGNDRILGFQVKTAWDVFGLMGKSAPDGTRTSVLADYYSDRGVGGGVDGGYVLQNPFGVPGQSVGQYLGYYVNDNGTDTLGGGERKDIPFEGTNRWRLLMREQHHFDEDTRLLFEVGTESDRNFLEQYFEPEYQRDKNTENLIYFSKNVENWGVTGLGFVPIDDFDNATGWYPKADLYTLSEPLFGGMLTWSQHSSVGYGDLHPGDLPDPNVYPADYANSFTPLPYLADVEGGVFMTRHQLDLHLPMGPLNIVPFVMGEAAYWEQGLDGEEVSRLTVSPGVRSSLQLARIYPKVHSSLFNLHGLAHKIRLEGEYRYTDTTEPIGNIAQYNDLDDDAQEAFRMRIPSVIFGGGPLPPEVDPRFYGVRTGVGSGVTSPVHEILDDQQVVRLALRQRLQTKRGPPGNMRIQDWMTLDLSAAYFPDADRDNFGESVGLAWADYEWFIGDRTSVFASARVDFFDNAPRTYFAGFRTMRSRRGQFTAQFQHIDAGDSPQNFVNLNYQYQLSPKWLTSLTATFDIADVENRSQAIGITRIGADWLFHLKLHNNEATNDIGASFMIEPRFGPRGASASQLASLFGQN
ncbi:LPS-assembly protein LptD [Calycomorphotria hydatis]|nr:hypothetical protein [Calycomorphotria hydatis]